MRVALVSSCDVSLNPRDTLIMIVKEEKRRNWYRFGIRVWVRRQATHLVRNQNLLQTKLTRKKHPLVDSGTNRFKWSKYLHLMKLQLCVLIPLVFFICPLLQHWNLDFYRYWKDYKLALRPRFFEPLHT